MTTHSAETIAFRRTAIAPRRTRAAGLVGPYWLVLAYAFLFYANPWLLELLGMPSLRLMMVLQIFMTGWLVVEKTIVGESFFLSWPDSHLLLLFLGTGIISASNSFWAAQTIQAVIDMGIGLAVYFLIINVITDRRRFRNLFWALALGGGVAAVSSMIRFFSGITKFGRAIYAGFFANSNDLAMAMVIILPIAIALFRGSRYLERPILFGIVAVLLATIYHTFSRGGALGLAAAVVAGGVRGGHAARLGLVAALIVAIMLLPFLLDNWSREGGFTRLEDDVSFQGRLYTIRLATEMFLSAPFTGVGLGASAWGSARFGGRFGDDYLIAIHNTYAQLFAEVGLVGALAYLLALGVSLIGVDRVARRAQRRADDEMVSYAAALQGSLAGFMVCAMAGPYLTTWVPLFLIALTSALRRVDKIEEHTRLAARESAGV